MPNFSEAYKSFEDFARRQGVIRESLQSQIRETREEIRDNEKALQKNVEAFFTGVDDPKHEMLTDVARTAGVPKDFTLMINGHKRTNEEFRRNIEALETQHGEGKALEIERGELTSSVQDLRWDAIAIDNGDEIVYRKIENAETFLEKYIEDPSVEDLQDAMAFAKQVSFGNIFRGDWWEARGIFGKDKPDNFIRNWEKHENYQNERDAMTTRIADMNKRLETIDMVLSSRSNLEKGIVSEGEILAEVHDNLLESLFDERFVDALAGRIGKERVTELALPVIKIVNLQKISGNLEEALEKLAPGMVPIEEALPKLRKAASRAGSRDSGIDTKAIEDTIVEQEKYASFYTRNAKGAVAGIRSHDPSRTGYYDDAVHTNSVLMNMHMWMMISVVADNNIDQAYMQHVDATIPVQAMEGQLSALGQSFDASANAISVNGVEVSTLPEISVSIPEISVSSIPDFSVGGGSIGGGDFGGFSGGGDGGAGGM